MCATPSSAAISKAYGSFPRAASSAPRRCDGRPQIRRVRPDLQVTLLRGNVQTRLAKLDRGEVMPRCWPWPDCVRLGLTDHATTILDTEDFLPAVGARRDRHHDTGRRRRRSTTPRADPRPADRPCARSRARLPDGSRRLLPHAHRRICAADRRRITASGSRAASQRLRAPSRSHAVAPFRKRRRLARRLAST